MGDGTENLNPMSWDREGTPLFKGDLCAICRDDEPEQGVLVDMIEGEIVTFEEDRIGLFVDDPTMIISWKGRRVMVRESQLQKIG